MVAFGAKRQQSPEEREAAIEAGKKSLREYLQGMKDLSPSEAERTHQRLKDWCGRDKTVPFEFKQKVLKRARDLECSANMRRCDVLIHEAMAFATEGKNKERNSRLSDSRQLFGKACTLGADAEWRKAFKRAEENVLMTGGFQRDTPSRAKPADIAPRPPNRTKD